MAVAGGVFCPPLMGAIADKAGMATGFILPLVCFTFIFWFGLIEQKKSKMVTVQQQK